LLLIAPRRRRWHRRCHQNFFLPPQVLARKGYGLHHQNRH
jgi:hypothetical protein